MFNITLGLLAALLAVVPLFWMKSKSGRFIGAVVALGVGICFYGFSKIYVYPEYLGWQFEHEIKKQPLFTLINQNYPAEFQEYIQKVKHNLRAKEDPDLVSLYSAELVNKIFYKSLSHAPDDYVALYLKSTIDLYHYLNSQDPKAVVKLENGDNAIDFDLSKLYENKDFQNRLTHLLDTKRYVIEASIKTPVAPPSPNQAEPLLKNVMAELSQKYGENVVREVFTTSKNVPPNVGAQVIIEFYAKVLGTGRENAGQIMRFIASLKDEPKNTDIAAKEQEKLNEEKH